MLDLALAALLDAAVHVHVKVDSHDHLKLAPVHTDAKTTVKATVADGDALVRVALG